MARCLETHQTPGSSLTTQCVYPLGHDGPHFDGMIAWAVDPYVVAVIATCDAPCEPEPFNVEEAASVITSDAEWNRPGRRRVVVAAFQETYDAGVVAGVRSRDREVFNLQFECDALAAEVRRMRPLLEAARAAGQVPPRCDCHAAGPGHSVSCALYRGTH